jgi:hypothetical protein
MRNSKTYKKTNSEIRHTPIEASRSWELVVGVMAFHAIHFENAMKIFSIAVTKNKKIKRDVEKHKFNKI